MKVRIFLGTLVLCLVLGVLFASCGNNVASNGMDSDTAASTYSETEKDTSPELETDPPETVSLETEEDEDARTPIENEKALSFIEFQYAKALEAISFAQGQLSCDMTTQIISEDGRICYPITDSTERDELDGRAISSLEDLSKYLKSIFARSIADDLIDTAKAFYIDVDGVFCLVTEEKADGFETEAAEETEEIEETESAEAMPGEDEADAKEPTAPVVTAIEFFLSDFTEKLFVYTAKVSFEATEEEHIEYFDFIFQNTGNGWYFTSFPDLPQ